MKTSKELDIEKKYKRKQQYRAGFKYRILEELVHAGKSLSFLAREHGVDLDFQTKENEEDK